MAIPAILGAAILELFRVDFSRLALPQFFIYLAGAVAAGVSGYFCIRKMLVIVRRKHFKGFAVYCLIIGIVAIAGYYIQR